MDKRKEEFKKHYENQVTEVHYSTIYEIKKHIPNIFSIYIIPKNIERAKLELKNRELPSEVVKKRLQEIEEHIKEYSSNKELILSTISLLTLHAFKNNFS